MSAALGRHFGNAARRHAEEHHRLVQHLVVLEMVEQHDGHAFGARRHEHRRPLHAHGRVALEAVRGRGRAAARRPPGWRRAACGRASRCSSARRRRSRCTSGTQPPCSILTRLATEEREVDDEEAADERADVQPRPAPPRARDDGEEQRRDRHRAGDGDAVRGAERARVPEGRATSSRQPTISALLTSGM